MQEGEGRKSVPEGTRGTSKRQLLEEKCFDHRTGVGNVGRFGADGVDGTETTEVSLQGRGGEGPEESLAKIVGRMCGAVV